MRTISKNPDMTKNLTKFVLKNFSLFLIKITRLINGIREEINTFKG